MLINLLLIYIILKIENIKGVSLQAYFITKQATTPATTTTAIAAPTLPSNHNGISPNPSISSHMSDGISKTVFTEPPTFKLHTHDGMRPRPEPRTLNIWNVICPLGGERHLRSHFPQSCTVYDDWVAVDRPGTKISVTTRSNPNMYDGESDLPHYPYTIPGNHVPWRSMSWTMTDGHPSLPIYAVWNWTIIGSQPTGPPAGRTQGFG